MLINLHTHLEGRIRPATAAELAAHAGLPGGKDWRRALQLHKPGDLSVYLEKVAASYPFFGSVDNLSRISCEAVEDAAADGADYLELRFGPATHVRPGMDVSAVLRAVCAGVAEGTLRSGMPAGVVVAALRHHDWDTNIAVARAAASQAGAGVVGFDLAGDELRYPRIEPYVSTFAVAKAAGLGLTCHAAEAAPAEAARDAVNLLGVTRVGHGTHIAHDADTMRWAADTGLIIEICPTSNFFTGAIAHRSQHPVNAFREAGIPIVLGDDNPTQTQSTLSQEQRILEHTFGFGPADLQHLDQTSVRAMFAEESVKKQLRNRL